MEINAKWLCELRSVGVTKLYLDKSATSKLFDSIKGLFTTDGPTDWKAGKVANMAGIEVFEDA